MNESQIQSLIFREIGRRADCRIFRNNCALGYVGQLIRSDPNGTVTLAHARPLHAGLIRGSADLIGWHSRIITDRDVGLRRAIFLSLEVKSDTGKPSIEQLHWQQAVADAGGIGAVVRSPEDAAAAIEHFMAP